MASRLPSGDSSTLALVHPTTSEQHTQLLSNSLEWKGALEVDAYLKREERLANLDLTREGGITFWILVDTAENVPAGSDRTVLAGCETLRKRGLAVIKDKLEDAMCHGVASVFSPQKYRGQGYGMRMMNELGKHLQTWQRVEGQPYFSVLYSDIGKKFYAKTEWHPYQSAHMQLPPLQANMSVTARIPESSPLTASALPPLCSLDEEILRSKLIDIASIGPKPKPAVAIIPDTATMAWHHAREDFVAQELFSKVPAIKGAQVLIPCPASPMGKRRAWGIWTRFWKNPDMSLTQGNTLHLLRLCVEPAPSSYDRESSFVEDSQALMSILHQAQKQAAEWGMAAVEVWNPAPATQQAVKLLAQDWSVQGGEGSGEKWGKVIDRDHESICCLRWYGQKSPGAGDDQVVWLENEKFGWN